MNQNQLQIYNDGDRLIVIDRSYTLICFFITCSGRIECGKVYSDMM